MLYIFLGIIQGLTEFLPVSSSGHLVLFSHIFNIEKSQILPIIIVCHIGTLLALLCFFARDILRVVKDLVFIAQIFIVTLVTGIFILAGRNSFENLFQRPAVVCLALLVTAGVLVLTKRLTKGRRDVFALNFKDAFWLGIAQGVAVVPGISRSGITIFSLLARGVAPEEAFKFSFIAGIPAIFGSFFLEAKEIGFIFNNHPANFWLAFGASYLFGLVGLFILKRIVKNLQLHYFGFYLLLASILGFMFVK